MRAQLFFSHQKAIEKYRENNSDYQFSFDEITGAVKKMAKLFNLKFGREYTDLRNPKKLTKL